MNMYKHCVYKQPIKLEITSQEVKDASGARVMASQLESIRTDRDLLRSELTTKKGEGSDVHSLRRCVEELQVRKKEEGYV